MELTAKISIKKAITLNPQIANKLLKSPQPEDIQLFADKCGFTPEFINQNLSLIKNWI